MVGWLDRDDIRVFTLISRPTIQPGTKISLTVSQIFGSLKVKNYQEDFD